MEQLDLAVQFLKKRAVKTKKGNITLIKQFNEVLPLFEVEAVLEMVKKGEFLNFSNEMKKIRHPDF